MAKEPTLEWVTPGHPLFEVVRESLLEQVQEALRHGAFFYDLTRKEPSVLDVFAASIKDGRGHTLHRRLFVVESPIAGPMVLRQPTVFHEIAPAAAAKSGGKGDSPRDAVPNVARPERQLVENFLIEQALQPWLSEVQEQRLAEVERVGKHVEISLNALIDRQQLQLAEYLNRQIEGRTVPGLDGLIAQVEQHLDDLNNRLEHRRRELEMERHATIADIVHLGRAVVAPHPDRQAPELAPMVRDEEVEKRAVEVAWAHEEARGFVVEDVQEQNRGFDLISRRPHPEDARTFIEVRFIEVKGRAGVGEVFLSANEYRAAERLKHDFWLYAVFNCAKNPELNVVQDPARLGWEPVVRVEQYKVGPTAIRKESVT